MPPVTNAAPLIHQGASTVEQVAPLVRPLDVRTHHVRQAHLGDVARDVRPLGRPGPETTTAGATSHLRALGLDGDGLLPYRTFQGTPMRHLGEHVGSFWLAEKAGAAGFTADDEELLVLFAAQAAVAVANARAFRDERRARADLEALVDTSPVGVVVFDAATARLVSLNREARRIVERLRQPGRTAEDLLDVITCRRADGTTAAVITWHNHPSGVARPSPEDHQLWQQIDGVARMLGTEPLDHVIVTHPGGEWYSRTKGTPLTA